MKASRGALLAAAGLAALILPGGPVEAQTKLCTVSGRVVEATTGKPVAGLKAMLLVAKGNARDVRQVTTNASGAFSTKAAMGSSVALYFVPGGADGSGAVLLDEEWMATWRPKEVKVAKDVTLKETVKTVPTRAVTLTILDPSGKPAARARVMAGRSAAQAGADGKALIRAPASSKGAEAVVMSADQTMGVYTRLDPGKTAATLKLARPETVSGTLMGSDGKPAAGVKLQVMPIVDGQPLYQLMGAGCTTDEHGRFEMKGFGIPTYALYWDKSEGFKRGEATVTLADRNTLAPATVQRAVYDPQLFAGSVCRTPETKVQQASCFALDADDNLLVSDEAGMRILKVSQDDKLMASWKLDFAPQALDIRQDGSIIVGGNGKVAILDANGTMQAAGAVPGKRAVSAVAHTGDDVFVCSYGDAGFAVYRMKDDLKDPKRIISNLSGCCGQMDIRAHGKYLYAAENTRFSIGKYDLGGKKVADFVHNDAKKNDYYGEGCCEPKNICFAPDGTILTAASGQMEVKRYDSNGKFLGAVAKLPDADGSCVRVTLGVSRDGSRVYILDTSTNTVRLLKQTAR